MVGFVDRALGREPGPDVGGQLGEFVVGELERFPALLDIEAARRPTTEAVTAALRERAPAGRTRSRTARAQSSPAVRRV
ncbi:hypothetical protein [Embleya sp. NPDC005575]|uniref:hypothetical protein n=1 Tax=Embleya sp. NPDC005575 TaxID=3156892 RepID=UPI0033B27B80